MLRLVLVLAGSVSAVALRASLSRAPLSRGLSMTASEPMQRITGRSAMEVGILDRYMALPQNGKIQAEYVWIDAAGKTRSKTRSLDKSRVEGAEGEQWRALPHWTFDGSSTGQAPGEDSEVIIRPVATYPDPFRPGNGNLLVLCDTYTPEGQPLPTNSRAGAAAIFGTPEALAAEPWFGCEQEYTLFNLDGVTPLGWPMGGYPLPQGETSVSHSLHITTYEQALSTAALGRIGFSAALFPRLTTEPVSTRASPYRVSTPR